MASRGPLDRRLAAPTTYGRPFRDGRPDLPSASALYNLPPPRFMISPRSHHSTNGEVTDYRERAHGRRARGGLCRARGRGRQDQHVWSHIPHVAPCTPAHTERTICRRLCTCGSPIALRAESAVWSAFLEADLAPGSGGL